MLEDFPADRKKQLEQQFDLLGPVRLLKHIRDAQNSVMAISEKLTPPPISEDLQKFVSSLATAWRSGEVRPTHRREPQPGRWWRTRRDPFSEVWLVLLSWLKDRPDGLNMDCTYNGAKTQRVLGLQSIFFV